MEFATPADWRAWLSEHHETDPELVVTFWKKGSRHPSITWAESVREALCFGWIDGVRRRVDDERFTIRFTPRKPGSTWSTVNVALVAELEAAGLMAPAGRAAFAGRRADRTGTYSHEQDGTADHGATLQALEADPQAWAWWSVQRPSYRKVALHHVASAKREATRTARRQQLVEDCAAGLKLKSLRW